MSIYLWADLSGLDLDEYPNNPNDCVFSLVVLAQDYDALAARLAEAEGAIERAGRCLVMSNNGAAEALAILRGYKQADSATDIQKLSVAGMDTKRLDWLERWIADNSGGLELYPVGPTYEYGPDSDVSIGIESWTLGNGTWPVKTLREAIDLAIQADQPSARLSCPVCHTSVLGVSGDGMIACGRIDCPAVTVQPDHAICQHGYTRCLCNICSTDKSSE